MHIVLDDSSTHKATQVEQFLAKRPRIFLHFTPTSASWLNAVQGWFGQLTRRALQRGVFTSVGGASRRAPSLHRVPQKVQCQAFRLDEVGGIHPGARRARQRLTRATNFPHGILVREDEYALLALVCVGIEAAQRRTLLRPECEAFLLVRLGKPRRSVVIDESCQLGCAYRR